MKYLITILFLFLTINIFSQTKNKTAIGFYNFENFYDTIDDPSINDEDFLPNGLYANTGKVFKEKVENLVSVISKMAMNETEEGVSLLGTAEIENDGVLQAICDHPLMKKHQWKFVHFDGPDARGIDCALFYNSKHFKVLNAESLDVDLGSDGSDDKYKTRDVLHVKGKLKGEIVHVFVNHWPSRRGGEAATRPKRKIAAAVSKRIIDSVMALDPNTKVVNMGDLNDDPINESMTKVLNCKAKIEDVKPGGLFNPWVGFYKKGLGTMAYNDAWSLFDQIVISYGFINKQNTGLHFHHAEVFNQSFMIEKMGQYKGYPKRSFSNNSWNNGYSDHFPTILFFE
jgi:hypothetical protein